jgi:hypothetical protein
MKTLHDAAINSAINSGEIALVEAGKELKSRKKIDASAANYAIQRHAEKKSAQ